MSQYYTWHIIYEDEKLDNRLRVKLMEILLLKVDFVKWNETETGCRGWTERKIKKAHRIPRTLEHPSFHYIQTFKVKFLCFLLYFVPVGHFVLVCAEF